MCSNTVADLEGGLSRLRPPPLGDGFFGKLVVAYFFGPPCMYTGYYARTPSRTSQVWKSSIREVLENQSIYKLILRIIRMLTDCIHWRI